MAKQHDGLPLETLSALVEASGTINSSLDLQRTLQSIASMAAAVMKAEAASVLMLDHDRNKLIFKAATGDRGDFLLNEEFDASLGIAGKVARTGKPAIVVSAREDPDFFKGIDDKSSFKTRDMVAAPLVTKERVIGVVEVLNKLGEHNFTRDDLELLQVFANLAASAQPISPDEHAARIEKARRFAKADPALEGRARVVIDSLTARLERKAKR